MIVTDIIGNISTGDFDGIAQDTVEIEWYESSKRIQRLRTVGGQDIAIRLLRDGQRLQEGDVLVHDDRGIIVVRIKPCEVIVIKPSGMHDMAAVCYEIGNKHMPLFLQDGEVLMPFEMSMFLWLERYSYQPMKGIRQLMDGLRANVEPHFKAGKTLFSKGLDKAILKTSI